VDRTCFHSIEKGRPLAWIFAFFVCVFMMFPDFDLRLKDPCGRMDCGLDWCRTRENSLHLADAELWLVWKGRGWMRTKDRDFDLLPGFCALMRPGGIYDTGHDESNPLGITFIHFDAWTGKKFREADAKQLYRGWPEFFEVPDLDFYDAAMRRMLQLFPRQPELAKALLKTTLLDLFHSKPRGLAGDSSVSVEQRKKIGQIVVSIHATAGRLPRVAEMADQLHWSTAHFSRVFKIVTQQSPRDFLLQVRLSRARHFLTETNLSIGEIADRLDYADLFFFSRQFKEKTGFSPQHYRQHIARGGQV